MTSSRQNSELSTPAQEPQTRTLPRPTCDIAIVTALPEELDPVLRLLGGRDQWREFEIDHYTHYAGHFVYGSHTFDVVACMPDRMGGDSTVGAVHRLKQCQPRLLVMTGICAGRQDKGIVLGDVVVADRAYHIGEGKHDGEVFFRDLRTYLTKGPLLQRLKDFAYERAWHTTITTPRPRSLRYQSEWLLCQIASQGTAFPQTDAERDETRLHCPNYTQARERLQKQGFLNTRGTVTTSAKKHLASLRNQHYGLLAPTPDPDTPKVYYMAFGSSEAVLAVEKPFANLAEYVRTTGAIDMEVASFYAAADQIGVDAFAVKGICDYATQEKDDLFHEYAAEASARWMYAFVCAYAQAWKKPEPPPKPSPSKADELRRTYYQKRLTALQEELEAVEQQHASLIDEGMRVILKRKMEGLLSDIEEIEASLRQLG